jgi:hypothetical protein
MTEPNPVTLAAIRAGVGINVDTLTTYRAARVADRLIAEAEAVERARCLDIVKSERHKTRSGSSVFALFIAVLDAMTDRIEENT